MARGAERGATAEEMDPQALANWWTTFDDPTLTSLIERAVRNNVDLKKARARVGEARASRGVSQASLFPTLGFTVSATRSHSSQNAMGDTQDVYANSIGFDASWELDLFGGVRRSVESATETLQANTEDLRNVLVSLLAEVAMNYIEARTNQTNRDSRSEPQDAGGNPGARRRASRSRPHDRPRRGAGHV
jgi:outer membrane protein TolC